MKRIIISVLVLIFGISFCMAQNIRDAIDEQKRQSSVRQTQNTVNIREKRLVEMIMEYMEYMSKNGFAPLSISERAIPDFNLMVLFLSEDGKVFLNFDNGHDVLLKYRQKTLVEMGNLYGIGFTEHQQREFEKYPSFIGVPMQNMVQFLSTQDPNIRKSLQTGIPIDSADNQLSMWILCARQVNPNIQIAIRGDANTIFSFVEQ